MATIVGIGVTAGPHRYWTHRSYKANVPFRIILMLAFCMSGQVKQYISNESIH